MANTVKFNTVINGTEVRAIDSVSLEIAQPTNISRNNGQLAQAEWMNSESGPMLSALASLMNCMEIDWGQAKWDGTEVDIEDLIDGDGIANVKSSYDVLRLLFYCIHAIQNGVIKKPNKNGYWYVGPAPLTEASEPNVEAAHGMYEKTIIGWHEIEGKPTEISVGTTAPIGTTITTWYIAMPADLGINKICSGGVEDKAVTSEVITLANGVDYIQFKVNNTARVTYDLSKKVEIIEKGYWFSYGNHVISDTNYREVNGAVTFDSTDEIPKTTPFGELHGNIYILLPTGVWFDIKTSGGDYASATIQDVNIPNHTVYKVSHLDENGSLVIYESSDEKWGDLFDKDGNPILDY